jgi:hypothetical protein
LGSCVDPVYQFFDNDFWAARYAWEAGEAAFRGDWESFAYYTALSAWHAYAWFWSTKIELSGPTYVFGGLEHGDLHEPGVLWAIAGVCAVN